MSVATMSARTARPMRVSRVQRDERPAVREGRRPNAPLSRQPRLQAPVSMPVQRGGVAVHSCAAVAPKVAVRANAAAASSWQLTERGLAVVIGACGVAFGLGLLLVLHTFWMIANTPL